MYGGDGGRKFWERHRFVWWVKVLGRQGWGRRRILAPPRVWDDRKLCGVAGVFSGMMFRIEKFMCFGRFGWQWNGAEKDICSRKMMEQERF